MATKDEYDLIGLLQNRDMQREDIIAILETLEILMLDEAVLPILAVMIKMRNDKEVVKLALKALIVSSSVFYPSAKLILQELHHDEALRLIDELEQEKQN